MAISRISRVFVDVEGKMTVESFRGSEDAMAWVAVVLPKANDGSFLRHFYFLI